MPITTRTQSRCEDLAAFAKSLVAACRENGYTDERLHQLLGAAVAATCVQCGIRLTARDLVALADPSDGLPPEDSRIARLRTGYCARNGCDSHYYDFFFADLPSLSWSKLLAQAGKIEEQGDALARAEKAAFNTARWRARRNKILRLVAGLCIIVALLIVRHWRNGGAIPIIRPLNELKIDPASVQVGGVCPFCGQVHSRSEHP